MPQGKLYTYAVVPVTGTVPTPVTCYKTVNFVELNGVEVEQPCKNLDQ